jgi:hypothetical protein
MPVKNFQQLFYKKVTILKPAGTILSENTLEEGKE